MSDAIDGWMRFEDLVESSRLGNVDIVEVRTLATNELDAIDSFDR